LPGSNCQGAGNIHLINDCSVALMCSQLCGLRFFIQQAFQIFKITLFFHLDPLQQDQLDQTLEFYFTVEKKPGVIFHRSKGMGNYTVLNQLYGRDELDRHFFIRFELCHLVFLHRVPFQEQAGVLKSYPNACHVR